MAITNSDYPTCIPLRGIPVVRQIIDIGAVPNDPTADTVRDAFDKVNDNFDESFTTVSNRTALKAVATATNTYAFLNETGREGLFIFTSGNYSTEVTADTQEGIYIKADDTASTSGAWIRAEVSNEIRAEWYGVSSTESNNSTALAAALVAAVNKKLILPSGTISYASTLNVSSGTTIEGVSPVATVMKLTSTGAQTGFSTSATSNVTFRNFSVDGNQSVRGGGASGSNFFNEATRTRYDNIWSFNSTNAGILCDGQVETCIYTDIENCRFYDNDGIGVSQHTTTDTFISGCYFQANGLENLSIDVTSYRCSVLNCHFMKHLGGCGNIGWDQSGDSRFIGNMIDNESDVTVSSGNRNGICFNALSGADLNSIVNSNTIMNCVDHGLLAKDQSGGSGTVAGSAVISGNVFKNNDRDIETQDTSTKYVLGANLYQAS